MPVSTLDPGETVAPPHRPRTMRAVSLVSVVIAVVFVVAALLPEPHTPVTYRFVIPAGTGARLAAGADISLFPERLTIDKGDVIDLVNEDSRNDEVGPFFVSADSELRQSVDHAGTFVGVCTLHRSGRVVIVVR